MGHLNFTIIGIQNISTTGQLGKAFFNLRTFGLNNFSTFGIWTKGQKLLTLSHKNIWTIGNSDKWIVGLKDIWTKNIWN